MFGVAIVPVKSFTHGKQRLADLLSTEQRQILGQAMVEHVTRVVTEAGLIPVLVTGDVDVATWAARMAIPSVPDPGQGLDAAAHAGVDWASHSKSRWVVLHSDLPLLTRSEVGEFWARSDSGDVIAPSADGGTSAISSATSPRFAFGEASFSRHLSRLDDPSIITTVGFLHDVDSPADLISARGHPRGRWLERILG